MTICRVVLNSTENGAGKALRTPAVRVLQARVLVPAGADRGFPVEEVPAQRPHHPPRQRGAPVPPVRLHCW